MTVWSPRVCTLTLLVLVTGAVAFQIAQDPQRSLFGDQAAHVIAAQSLWFDGDLVYTVEDLERFRSETPYSEGPRGIFLKRGSDERLYYAKPFTYALLASPLVALAGVHGFTLLNLGCLLVIALVFALAVGRLVSPVWVLVLGSGLFLFSPFLAWVDVQHPDLLIAALLSAGGALVLARGENPALSAVGGLILGVCLFEKPTFALLVGPIILCVFFNWYGFSRHGFSWRGLDRHRFDRNNAALVGVLLGCVLGWAIPTGFQILQDGNLLAYQGERFYVWGKPQFPLEPGWVAPVGSVSDRIFDVKELVSALLGNVHVLPGKLVDFFVGRQTGILVYFAPAIVVLVLILVVRPFPWQALIVFAGFAALNLLYWLAFPANGFGGSQSFGSRYLMQMLPALWLAAYFVRPVETPTARSLVLATASVATVGLTLLLHFDVPRKGADFVGKPRLFLETHRAAVFPLEWPLVYELAPLLSREFRDDGPAVALYRVGGDFDNCYGYGLAGGDLIFLSSGPDVGEVSLDFEVSKPVEVVVTDNRGPETLARAESVPGARNRIELSLTPELFFSDLTRGPIWISEISFSGTLLNGGESAPDGVPDVIRPSLHETASVSASGAAKRSTSLCWSDPERDGTWTSGRVAGFSISAPAPSAAEKYLVVDFIPLIPRSGKGVQRVRIFADGERVFDESYTAGDQKLQSARVPLSENIGGGGRDVNLLFEVSNPSRPGGSISDLRFLGIKLIGADIREMPDDGW